MSRISTAIISQSALADLSRAQRTLVETARQSSSQTKADDLKGYGRQAQALVSAERLVGRTEGFVSTIRELKTRFELQDVALSRASTAISELKQGLFQSVTLGRGDGVESRLEETFSVLKDALNTNIAGRYLFGGALNDRPPFVSDSLTDLVANPITDALERDASPQFLRIEENRTIETGVLAPEVATRALESIRRIAELHATTPFEGQLTTSQIDALTEEVAALTNAFDQALQAQSRNGLLLNQVTAAETRHTAHLETLNNAIGDIVEVDLAEVAVRLNQAQYAYEASATVFSTLRGLSLLEYLN